MKLFEIHDKLYLRQLRSSDAIDIYNTLNNHREYFKKWLPFVNYTLSVKDSEAYVKSILTDNSPYRDIVYSIFYENKFVGLIAFKGIDFFNKKTEFGYWLSANYQKKGIITQSLRKMIDYAFNELKLNRVQIKCAVGNTASSNVSKRLNFKLEGIEREGEYYDMDKYFDIEVYSLLRKEWTEVI